MDVIDLWISTSFGTFDWTFQIKYVCQRNPMDLLTRTFSMNWWLAEFWEILRYEEVHTDFQNKIYFPKLQSKLLAFFKFLTVIFHAYISRYQWDNNNTNLNERCSRYTISNVWQTKKKCLKDAVRVCHLGNTQDASSIYPSTHPWF